MRAGVGVPVALIGGPARVGKSTLALRLLAQCPSELVHLDNLRAALLSVAGVDEAAALRKAPSVTTNTPKQWLAELRARDAVLWTAAREYAAAAQAALVLEGGLWPDWVAGLEQSHVAVFVVDNAADMADRLIEIAEGRPIAGWLDVAGRTTRSESGPDTTGFAVNISRKPLSGTAIRCSTSPSACRRCRTGRCGISQTPSQGFRNRHRWEHWHEHVREQLGERCSRRPQDLRQVPGVRGRDDRHIH